VNKEGRKGREGKGVMGKEWIGRGGRVRGTYRAEGGDRIQKVEERLDFGYLSRGLRVPSYATAIYRMGRSIKTRKNKEYLETNQSELSMGPFCVT